MPYNDGFLVPSSIGQSYIDSKRTEEGSFQYDSYYNRAGIQKQSALQSLGNMYESTIENAYASYLASQRGIMGSNLGQGYKEAYLQNQQQALMSNIAEGNLTLAKGRAELSVQEVQEKAAIDKQREAEIGNINRVAKTFENYLGYVKSLSKDGKSPLSEEQMNMSVDDLYETLQGERFQPQSYLDTEGNMGLPYSQWVNQQLTTSTVDTAFGQWFNQGGLSEFLQAVRQRDYKTIEEQLISTLPADYNKVLSEYNKVKNAYDNFAGAKTTSVRSPGRGGQSRKIETAEYKKVREAYEAAKAKWESSYSEVVKNINASSLDEATKKKLIEELK